MSIEPELPGSGRDEAERRFWTINVVRLMGVAFVVVGLLMATERLFEGLPSWIGYILLANGLLDFFVIPLVLARKWRSPR